jgi:hypothetical protein
MAKKSLPMMIDVEDLQLDMHSNLPPLLEQWCQSFYSTGDAVGACVAVGFPESKANSLRVKPRIRARLREMATQSLEDLKERRGQLVEFLLKVVRANIVDYVDHDYAVKSDLSREAGFAVKSVKPTKYGTQLELYDRIKAIELLAEISGLKVDKVDITSGGLPIKQAPVNITFEVAKEPRLVEAEISGESSSFKEEDKNDISDVKTE